MNSIFNIAVNIIETVVTINKIRSSKKRHGKEVNAVSNECSIASGTTKNGIYSILIIHFYWWKKCLVVITLLNSKYRGG